MTTTPMSARDAGSALGNAKHERFCLEYVRDLNATQAAIRAGYAARNANVTGPRLRASIKVAARIAELQAQITSRLEISAELVLREAARLAFSDPRKFFNVDGSLKPITQLDDDAAAALASFESVEKLVPDEDGKTEEIRKLKLWDKPSALVMLGRHFKLFVEKIDVGGDLAAALDRARNRRSPGRS